MPVAAPLFALLLVLLGSLTAAIALLMGRTPVLTEFEGKQRGIETPQLSRKEREERRRRSDATMKTAVSLFIFIAATLVLAGLITYAIKPELASYFIPPYLGMAALSMFVIMWIDEERMKKKHREMKMRR